MLLGTSDDAELLNRLADDLLRFDIRASANQLSLERPDQIGSSVTALAGPIVDPIGGRLAVVGRRG